MLKIGHKLAEARR